MIIAACLLLFCVLMVSLFAFGYHQYGLPLKMLRQLQSISSFEERKGSSNSPTLGWATRLLSNLGGIMPSSPGEAKLKKRELAAAGFRSASAPAVLAGLKLLLPCCFLIAGIAFRNLLPNPALRLAAPILFTALGYKFPDLILARLTARRQLALRLALPDALDMLVVCCEAGCALDQAIVNVSREFKVVHPALSEELSIVNMELLAGASRIAALRNLAARTGEDEFKKLVAILIQTDRFGTSVADALRTQAEFMRIKRRQTAQEKAGKVGVKLIFPIFFFCMPSLGVLVIGPGIIQILRGLHSGIGT